MNPNPFDEYEAEMLAKSRKEIQAELQAWEALSHAEKEAKKLSDEKTHENWCKALEACVTTNEDEDEDEDEDD